MILKIVFMPFCFLNKLAKKKKDVWLFGAFLGNKYFDNTKSLFEYVSTKEKNIQAVWLTKNRKVIDSLREEGFYCYHFYSLKGIYYAIIAKVIFVTHSWVDVSYFVLLFSLNSIFIQLWHGTPLKKLYLKGGSLISRILRKLLIYYLKREFDYVVSATELNKKIYSKWFSISLDRVLVLGQPRNDLLFNKKIFQKYEKNKKQKIFLYMPTYRSPEYTPGYSFDPIEDDFLNYAKEVETFLIKNNSYLYLKIHHGIFKKFSKKLNFKRIKLFDKEEDVYESMHYFDTLITDYSSVYFDFLLLDKPIIFITTDLAMYAKIPGFCRDFSSATPGPKAKNWKEVLNFLEEIIKNKSFFEKKRSEVNNKFNYFKDGNSSKRITNFVKKY